MGKKKTQEQLNRYLQKEIEKAESLGLKLYPIYPEVIIGQSKTTFGYCSIRQNRSGEVSCKIHLSNFVRKFKKKEIKSILMHEVLHAVIGSKGHNAVWKRNCSLVKENFSYGGYEKYHLHERPYSRNRAKKAKVSGLYQ